MSLVDHCSLVLRDFRHDEDGDYDDLSDEGESRFSVASDMKASDQTPLKMYWAQFVWLALALGISTYDPGWRSGYPCTLSGNDHEDLVDLSLEEDRVIVKFAPRAQFTYSLRRAFWWYTIKLEGDRLLPLGHSERAPVDLSSLTISPEPSACRLGMDLQSHGCSNTVSGKEPQDCNNALPAASYWMLHWHGERFRSGELVPVSQNLLEYRQRALCHLKILDEQQRLVTKLRSLLLAETVHDTHQGSTSGVALSTARTSASVLPHPDLSLGVSTKTGAAEKTQPRRTLPLSRQHQSLVEAVLEQLRSSFASSEYVGRHALLYNQTKRLETQWILEARLRGTETRMRNSKGLTHMPKDWQSATRGWYSNGWSYLGPQAGQNAESRKGGDLYDLFPLNLKTELESNVLPWSSDPDGDGSSRWNEADGIGFLACVALALADWDVYGRETWRLRPMAEQVNKLLVDLKQAMHPDDFLDHGSFDQFSSLFQNFAADVLKRWLYKASSVNPVRRLLRLRDSDSIVYLL